MRQTMLDGVAPPGWEKTIKKMKKNKDIDNPWALAWYMKNQQYKPAKHAEADGDFEKALQAVLSQVAARSLPAIFHAAARGEAWACGQLLAALPLQFESRHR